MKLCETQQIESKSVNIRKVEEVAAHCACAIRCKFSECMQMLTSSTFGKEGQNLRSVVIKCPLLRKLGTARVISISNVLESREQACFMAIWSASSTSCIGVSSNYSQRRET